MGGLTCCRRGLRAGPRRLAVGRPWRLAYRARFAAGGRGRGRCGAAGERLTRLDPAFRLSRRAPYTLGSGLRTQPVSALHAWIRPSGSACERLTRLYPAFGLRRRAPYTLGSGLRAQPESAFHVCIGHFGSAERGATAMATPFLLGVGRRGARARRWQRGANTPAARRGIPGVPPRPAVPPPGAPGVEPHE